jgi:hypothetical protein
MSAKGKRIQKKVIYKRVEFHTAKAGETLKTLLASALKMKSTFGERKLNVSDADQPIFHMIGSYQDEAKGFVFGTFMTFTPGTDPLYLVDDEQAVNVMVEKLKAPNTVDGKKREFLESIMHFGIIQNHVVLMQSQALKSPQLESYLRWLLHDSAVLAGDNTFQLVDSPSKEVRAKMNKAKGVRAITVGGEVLPPSLMHINKSTDKVETKTEAKSISVTAKQDSSDWGPLAAIKSLLEPAQAAKIDFDKLSGSNIELTVTVRYKQNTTEDGHKLMDTLGAAFRNTEDVETAIELIGGGQIKGSELKLDGTIPVTSYDGQLNSSEVFEGMRQWLLSKVNLTEL